MSELSSFLQQLARMLPNGRDNLDLDSGRPCWPSPYSISSGDRPSWQSASGCAKSRRSCLPECASSPPALFSTPGCAPRAQPSPSRREWASLTLLAAIIFLVDYGLVFWAEQRVPSGITAVMMATIPVFTALLEILILRTQKLTLRLGCALVVGLVGVAVLVSRSAGFGDAPIERSGAIALVVGAISWSLATILTRKLRLPESKVMSSGAQMLVGGILLLWPRLFSESSTISTGKPFLQEHG